MNKPEFTKATTDLASDILLASIHLKLHSDLSKASQDEYQGEFNEAPTFWWLTFRAHYLAALTHLAKAFDQNRGSLGLLAWIKKARSNWDSLGAANPSPSNDEFNADLELVSKDDEVVSKLVVARNKLHAHRDLALAIGKKPIPEDLVLKHGDILALVERAMGMLHKYGGMILETSWAEEMQNADDYRVLLDATRYYVVGQKNELRRQLGLEE